MKDRDGVARKSEGGREVAHKDENGWRAAEEEEEEESAVKSSYATSFSPTGVLHLLKKTALQLVLAVPRVLVSPNHMAVSRSPRRACC